MENLVGKKMKGFAFHSKENWSYNSSKMDKHIGEIGEIKQQGEYVVTVQFKDNSWTYPLAEALQHIVQEEPTIPELKEGVLMEVSHDGEDWFQQKIIAKYKDIYINNVFSTYKYARPIQETNHG